jgi:predicted amino acid-binding ACT domain protein
VGIVATLSRVLADHGANITEMSTRLLDRTRVPVYLVRIECRVEAGWDALEAALADAAAGLGIDLRAEPLESTDL